MLGFFSSQSYLNVILMNKKAVAVTSPLDYIILLSVSSSEECLASKERNALELFGETVCVELHRCFKLQIRFLWIATPHAIRREFLHRTPACESVDGTSVTSPALFANTNFRVLEDVA